MATFIDVQTDSALDKITWTFSQDCQTGTFANGEPWVVGPVTIVNISPKPTDTPDIRRVSAINGPQKETVLRTVSQPKNAVGTLAWPHGPLQDPNSNTPRQGVGTVWHGSMINPTLDDWGSSQYSGYYAPPNGFDTRIDYSRSDSTAAEVTASVSTYKNALNVALKVCEGAANGVTNFTLQAGDMLFSARSYVNPNPADSGKDGSYYSTCLQKIAVLTVLSAAPPTGSFRPSLWGTDKTVNWNISDIDWSVFKELSLPAGSGSDTTAAFTYEDMTKIMPSLPWIEWHDNATTSLSIPTLNSSALLSFNDPTYYIKQSNTSYPNGTWFDTGAAAGESYDISGAVVREAAAYGREAADKFGSVALWLNTGSLTDDKKRIAYRYIQNGLDIFDWLYKYDSATSSWIRRGPTSFSPDGAHRQGRKLPVVVAAACLGAKPGAATTALKYAAGQWKAVNGTVSGEGFAEDATVFTVNTGDLTRTINPPSGSWAGRPFATYDKSWLGKADWGIQHSRSPTDDNAYQDSTYRSVQHMESSWLACRLMNLHTVWNHDAATVLYFERYHGPAAGAILTATTNTASFMYARMMPAYFNLFFIGRKIVTKQATAVRGAAGSGSSTNFTANKVGTIIAGPTNITGVNWWQIRYKNGPTLATPLTGWSPETDINVLGAGFNTTIDGRGGIFEAGKAVSLITSVPDASVYYTTSAINSPVTTPADYDSSSGVAKLNPGSTIGTSSYSLPSGVDTVFTTAIVREGYDMSDVTSATYRIDSSGKPVQPSQSRGVASSTQPEPALIFGPTSTLTQYGITWTFASQLALGQYGQFVNGDWWVVGPVDISNINPKTVSGGDPINGSMLNPIPNEPQGLCNRGEPGELPLYAPAKNIALQLPYSVAPENSVYSTMDNPDTYVVPADPSRPQEKTYFKETAVLTVLSVAPPAGSFRPPYAGTAKTIKGNWKESSMNYAVLRKLAAPIPANVPNREWMEDATQRPLLELNRSYLNSQWKASWAETKAGGYPRRTYGREIAHISAGAGLYLQTDVSDATKRQLLINMCQWGIDVYGLLGAGMPGMQWQANGGHQHGRLLPLYIAAKVLVDAEMLDKCGATNDLERTAFQEYGQHWIVEQLDVDTPRVTKVPPLVPYTTDQIGMPEWSSNAIWERDQASSYFPEASYRWLNGAPNCGMVATALLMGGRAEIGYEPLFRYIIERHYPYVRALADKTLPEYADIPTLFTRDMWDAYVDTNTGATGATGATGLPPGLTLNTVTGLISGTPTTAGTYPLTVSATNASGTGTKALTITINPAAIPVPNITSDSTATGHTGVAFTYQITATGNPTSFAAY